MQTWICIFIQLRIYEVSILAIKNKRGHLFWADGNNFKKTNPSSRHNAWNSEPN